MRRSPAGRMAAVMVAAAGLSACTMVGAAPAPAPVPGTPGGDETHAGGAVAEPPAEGRTPPGGAGGTGRRPPPDFRRDGPPGGADSVDLAAIPDAVPRAEPRAASGNPERYTVNGREYRVLESAEGYEEEGVASWYGREFHGRTTASGEPYDALAMTAAHRTLPLPTYVEVTNLENGRRVVVRVNDRGPFHDDRLIDLSYAAAWKLGIVEQGTARVRVRALVPGGGR